MLAAEEGEDGGERVQHSPPFPAGIDVGGADLPVPKAATQWNPGGQLGQLRLQVRLAEEVPAPTGTHSLVFNE